MFTYGKHDPGMGHGGGANEHPTQKPRLLMAELVALFTSPGEVIADPFTGSGTTGVAALQAGRVFVGMEKNAAHFDVACRRIEQAWKQRPLFGIEQREPPQQLGLPA